MTPSNSHGAPESGRRLLLIIAGLIVLGLALVLLLSGRGRIGGETGDEPLLQSIPAFSGTPESAVAPLDPDLADLPVAGSLAPEFALPDLEGETVRLSDFRDRPVVLNFWATWCGPCRLEMPELDQAQSDYNDAGLAILLINQQESPERVRAFAEELGLSTPILLDSETQAGRAYGAFYLPSTVFIGPDGVVSAIHRGIISRDQLDGYLADMGVEAGG